MEEEGSLFIISYCEALDQASNSILAVRLRSIETTWQWFFLAMFGGGPKVKALAAIFCTVLSIFALGLDPFMSKL